MGYSAKADSDPSRLYVALELFLDLLVFYIVLKLVIGHLDFECRLVITQLQGLFKCWLGTASFIIDILYVDSVLGWGYGR